ncbi:MAG: UDP-N-acetylmuramoyl-L-alanyl-D-glutamate--2,6-diaminopimelate ligase [Epsilonproteobacteria bacterium]|nr:UDP-N-acetylmuramoyl-L-alanyl-D-glutamate--2,6-diaminopimelate ligase [Campylobacterota bacterium]
MKIIKNNQLFTDNTAEITNDAIFVCSKNNEKFLEQAQTLNPKAIIKDSELKNYFDFSSLKVVGITGTNGKTTTAGAIYSFLLDLGYKVALLGTRGLFINGERVREYSFTTPFQIEMFANLELALSHGCEYFVTEVSSHAIAQNRICGVDFALKIHTNITGDHLDYHKTMEEYISTKNSFFQDDTPKLINKDDKNVRFKLKNAYSYGLDNPATYKVQAFTFKDGTNIVIQYFGELFTFNSGLRGTFNVYNLTAALGAVHILTKIDLNKICEVVDNFAGVSGRMETISFDPYIIVDFAHTPDGMRAIFESFKDKNIITVFGAGGDRDRLKRPLMGAMADEYSKYIFLTSDNPRTEDPDVINDEILAGIKNKEKCEVELNRKVALTKAIQKTKEIPNSVILVLGKGDEEYQIVYDKKFPFSDKKVILGLLEKE